MYSENLQLPVIVGKLVDIHQLHYGDHLLDAICGAGQTKRPKLALVFINPTYRNIATDKNREGLKAPWIGTMHAWQLLANAGLIGQDMNDVIQNVRSQWDYGLAKHVFARGVYITNIVKRRFDYLSLDIMYSLAHTNR